MDDLAILLHETVIQDKNLSSKKSKSAHRKLKSDELKLLAASLARLLEGGIPILRALEVLESSSGKEALKQFLRKLQNEIRQGRDFSGALGCEADAVPSYFIQLVRAGEASGTMPSILKELSVYLEKEETLKRKMREALTYPGFILITGIVTLGVLMRFVIPKLAGVYHDFGSELPMMTRCIMTASEWSLPVFVTGFFTSIFLGTLFSKHEKLRAVFFYRLPGIGKLLKSFALIQFSRLMGLLMESGITVLEALDMTRDTFSDPFLKEDTAVIRGHLAEGKGFANSLSHVRWMDSLSKMLIISGEESGRLPESFRQIAVDIESQMESQIQWVLKMLEPALILGVGIIVGIVVIGTVLPIFDISGLMK